MVSRGKTNKTSQRIKTVWDVFNKEGKVHVTLAPYGYIYDRNIKNFLINRMKTHVVKRIFNLYLSGYGFNNIAQMLTSEGIPTKKGGKWAGATIRGMLTNEFYIGTLIKVRQELLMQL